MNRENFEKLLQATREAPAETFNMNVFVGVPTACGTPACLLGSYALRTDLQSAFKPSLSEAGDCDGFIITTSNGQVAWCDDLEVCEHFDITGEQASRLFDADGCNVAGTDRDRAIAYVEHFMATGETPHDYDDEDDDGWTDEEDDGE